MKENTIKAAMAADLWGCVPTGRMPLVGIYVEMVENGS